MFPDSPTLPDAAGQIASRSCFELLYGLRWNQFPQFRALHQKIMDFEKNIAKAEELGRDSRKTSLSFLKTEIAAGMTFAKVAQDAENGSAKRTRNQANARKAYDTIVEWHQRYSASDALRIDMRELEPELSELRSVLQELGEHVN